MSKCKLFLFKLTYILRSEGIQRSEVFSNIDDAENRLFALLKQGLHSYKQNW